MLPLGSLGAGLFCIMTWNYRVIRKKFEHKDGSVEYGHYIHLAFYEKRGDKRPNTISVEPTYPYGETPKELKSDLEMMARALESPVLDHWSYKNGEEDS